MIRAELRFESILCLAERSRHYSGIGDDHIEQTTIGYQLVRSGAHTLQAGEIEFNHLEARSTLCRGLAHFGGSPPCLVQIARCAHNVRAMGRERTCCFYTETS